MKLSKIMLILDALQEQYTLEMRTLVEDNPDVGLDLEMDDREMWDRITDWPIDEPSSVMQIEAAHISAIMKVRILLKNLISEERQRGRGTVGNQT